MSAARYLTFCVTLAVSVAATAADRLPAPSFWDPNLHLERPDLSALRAIRFLTDDDYPPLDFALADGSLVGFNVEIARAICEELHIGCTIQARRWDTLVDSLETGKGDAVIASIAANAATRARIDFTQPYYKTPARFAVRKDSPLADVTPTTVAGKTVGVIAGSAHQSYLATFFPAATGKPAASSDVHPSGRSAFEFRSHFAFTPVVHAPPFSDASQASYRMQVVESTTSKCRSVPGSTTAFKGNR